MPGTNCVTRNVGMGIIGGPIIGMAIIGITIIGMVIDCLDFRSATRGPGAENGSKGLLSVARRLATCSALWLPAAPSR